MKSSSGAELLDAGGIKFVATELLKRASVITPNVPEAEVLTGLTIKDVADMEAAARKLVEMGAHSVIVKGGHMERAVDVLLDGNEMVQLGGDRVKTENTHGTGCTFASAIAAQLAAGRSLSKPSLSRRPTSPKPSKKVTPSAKAACPSIIFIVRKSSPSPVEHTKCPSMACTPPPNPPPTRN